jgi:hypothetical protein
MTSQRYVAARRALLLFALALLLTAAIYRRTPTAFLRAESGWYLCVSHMDEATRRRAEREFFAHSYLGHYTPLAFLAEFRMAKMAGTSRAFWRWRQILAVAAVGAAIFGLVVAITRTLGLSRGQRLAIGGAMFALITFQPAMVDFVTWPFMILQLGWVALSILALFCLTKIPSTSHKSSWAWLAAAAAYASLHVLGLGLVTVSATAVSLCFYAVIRNAVFRTERIRLLQPCGVLLILTVLHAWAMLPRGQTSLQFTGWISAIKFTLGFIFNFALAGLRSFVPVSVSVPSVSSIAYCWPLGLLLMCLASVGLYRYTRRTLIDATPARLMVTMLLLFSAAGFVAMATLIGVRQILGGPDEFLVLPYFTVMPRYVIPLQFILVGSATLIFTQLAKKMPRLIVVVCWLLVPALMVAQMEYQKNAMAFLTPATRVSHYTAWRLLVAAARECRAAGLLLPNFSLAPLTKEFSEADVKMFLPLLRHDLHLPANEEIGLVPVEVYKRGEQEQYKAAPSLKALEQKLELARD